MSKKKNTTKFQRLWGRYQKYLTTTDTPMSFIDYKYGPNPPYFMKKKIEWFILNMNREENKKYKIC